MFTNDLRDVIKALKIKSVLDVGCGFGHKMQAFEGLEYTGIDVSRYAIEKARQYYPNKDFQIGDVLSYFSLKRFDLVFTSGVLEHINPKYLERALRNILMWSNKYILNIEAYDDTEHPINWHRGKNKFWTVCLADRWKYLGLKIIHDYNLDDEYRLTLVSF